MKQEMLSLPKNIAEELRRSAFPGKSIRKTHVLVRMPKGLTLQKLGELAKKSFPITRDGYKIGLGWTGIGKLKDKPAPESVWLLMTNDVIPGSRDKTYSQQKDLIAKLAQTAGVLYQDPSTLEAATCMLAEYSRSRNRLFSDEPWTYTRCQDFPFVVGGVSSEGLIVNRLISNRDYYTDVAALLRF